MRGRNTWREGTYIWLSFFLPIKNVDQTNQFWLEEKVRYLKKSGYCGSSAIVLSCLCGYFAGPKFFHGYFVGLTFFLFGVSWLGFPDCNIFSCWRFSDRNQKYINISKTEYSAYISTSSTKLVMLLHSFNLPKLCFYSSLFFSIRISSLVTVMDFIIVYY